MSNFVRQPNSAGASRLKRASRSKPRARLAPFGKAAIALLTLVVLAAFGGYWAYVRIGHSPGELMDYAERRLEGHPRLEAATLPVLAKVRVALNAPSKYEKLKQPFIVPAPSKPWPAPRSPAADSLPATEAGQIIKVGPNETIHSAGLAAQLAHDGDIIEIQAGEYHGDVAIWSKKHLTIKGVGGNARFFADGRSAEGKAIWVMRGDDILVENIDFIGADVPDKNGAGIRFETGSLHIRNCLFYGNQEGLLTANDTNATLTIENSEFAYNGVGDGQTHDLYVGSIRSLKAIGNYFHHANAGHLLKSRAAYNYIAYNRLTDEDGGRASYELEFPNGGIAYVIGNIIQQSPTTENSTLISYGAEHYRWPRNSLYLASNTLVNDLPYGGTFLRVAPGAGEVLSLNNLLIGFGDYLVPGTLKSVNDIHADWSIFANAVRQDYRLNEKGQKLAFKPQPVDWSAAGNLIPQSEYIHPRQTRPLAGPPLFPGAIQQPATQRTD